MSIREARLVLVAAAALAAFGLGLLFWPEQVMEGCRVVNVGLGVIVAAGFFVRVNDLWPRYHIGARIARTGVLLLILVAAGGSAEAYVTHAEPGFRSVVLTLALLTIGVGLLALDRDD